MAGIIYTPPAAPPTPPVTPAAPVDSVQFNNAGSFGGMLNLSQKSGFMQSLNMQSVNTPPLPATNHALIYTADMQGVPQLRLKSKISIDTPLQNSIANKVVGFSMVTSSLTHYFNYQGWISITANTQARSTKTADALNALPNITYWRLTSSGALNAVAEYWGNTTTIGAVVGYSNYNTGGLLVIQFGLPTYAAGQRIFAGYSASAAQIMGTAEPSNLLNLFGIAKDSTDLNFHIIFNDGAGAATKFNTGIAPVANGFYRVSCYLMPDGQECFVNFEQILNGSISSYYMSRKNNIPAQGLYLTPHVGCSSAGSVTPVTMGIVSVYEEQI
jgi:hypothetical protein